LDILQHAYGRLLPVVIIPLFFKYKPFSDSALKGRIIDLAGKMQVKILDVFEIDFSKRRLRPMPLSSAGALPARNSRRYPER